MGGGRKVASHYPMNAQQAYDAMDKLPNDTAEKLRAELIRIQIEGLKLSQENMRQRLDARIDSTAADLADHEKRLRAVEDSATKFNFILYLTMGGGLVGLINLGLLAFTLINTMAKP